MLARPFLSGCFFPGPGRPPAAQPCIDDRKPHSRLTYDNTFPDTYLLWYSTDIDSFRKSQSTGNGLLLVKMAFTERPGVPCTRGLRPSGLVYSVSLVTSLVRRLSLLAGTFRIEVKPPFLNQSALPFGHFPNEGGPTQIQKF